MTQERRTLGELAADFESAEVELDACVQSCNVRGLKSLVDRVETAEVEMPAVIQRTEAGARGSGT